MLKSFFYARGLCAQLDAYSNCVHRPCALIHKACSISLERAAYTLGLFFFSCWWLYVVVATIVIPLRLLFWFNYLSMDVISVDLLLVFVLVLLFCYCWWCLCWCWWCCYNSDSVFVVHLWELMLLLLLFRLYFCCSSIGVGITVIGVILPLILLLES